MVLVAGIEPAFFRLKGGHKANVCYTSMMVRYLRVERSNYFLIREASSPVE